MKKIILILFILFFALCLANSQTIIFKGDSIDFSGLTRYQARQLKSIIKDDNRTKIKELKLLYDNLKDQYQKEKRIHAYNISIEKKKLKKQKDSLTLTFRQDRAKIRLQNDSLKKSNKANLKVIKEQNDSIKKLEKLKLKLQRAKNRMLYLLIGASLLAIISIIVISKKFKLF